MVLIFANKLLNSYSKPLGRQSQLVLSVDRSLVRWWPLGAPGQEMVSIMADQGIMDLPMTITVRDIPLARNDSQGGDITTSRTGGYVLQAATL